MTPEQLIDSPEAFASTSKRSSLKKRIIIVTIITTLIVISLLGFSYQDEIIRYHTNYQGYVVINTEGEVTSKITFDACTDVNEYEQLYAIRGIDWGGGFSGNQYCYDVNGNKVDPAKPLPPGATGDKIQTENVIFTLAENFYGKCIDEIYDYDGNEIDHSEIDSAIVKASAFTEGLLLMKSTVSEKYGYADEQGKWAIAPQYDDAQPFYDGLACAKKDDLWGFVDHTGSYVIAPRFKFCADFSEGYAAVSEDGEHFGIIDTEGNYVLEPTYAQLGGCHDGLFWAKESSGGEWGCIDASGNVVIDFQFNGSAWNFKNGYAMIKNSERLYGFIDTSGNITVPCMYERAKEFSADGYAAVEKDGLWGYVDANNNWLLEPQFKEARDFQNGYAIVYLNKNQLIKFNKNTLSGLRITYLLRYAKGIAVVIISFAIPLAALVLILVTIYKHVKDSRHY